MTYPTPELELSLLKSYDYILGVDEVGRGAIAGPVAVGGCLLSVKHLDLWPKRVRDSKLLSERARNEVEPEIRQWAPVAVGLASATEIELFGITKALAIAAVRAIEELMHTPMARGSSVLVLLDGTHNWLADETELAVRVEKKADQTCVSVAAASVVAKVYRDQLMVQISDEHPGYGLAGNKGYASQEHISALQTRGPSPVHRVSWLAKILADGQLF